jgi:dihydrofolate reductase
MAAEGEWADRLNPMPKFVASRTLQEPLIWNATLLKGELEDAVATLKAEREGDLITNGCGELTRNLYAAGLVDEFWFSVHPAVWGKGERPFWEEEKVRLSLLGTETYDSGVVLTELALRAKALGLHLEDGEPRCLRICDHREASPRDLSRRLELPRT